MDASVFTSNFYPTFQSFCSLDSDFNVRTKDTGDYVTAVDPSGDFGAVFASSYEKYSVTGTVLGASHGSQDPSLLENFINGLSGATTVTDLATVFANYWATVAILPGSPAHGGLSVVSVVNDAAAKVSLFEAAITASIGNKINRPFYEEFINNLYNIAVSNIVWTVTELIQVGPSTVPTPFPETIT